MFENQCATHGGLLVLWRLTSENFIDLVSFYDVNSINFQMT